MKNIFFYLTMILLLFSSLCFSQKQTKTNLSNKFKTEQKSIDSLIEINPAIKRTITSFFVEEKINHKFGGSITSYEVSRLSLIPKNNLGPNNERIITPRYKIEKLVPVKKPIIQPKEVLNSKISGTVAVTPKGGNDQLKQIDPEPNLKESKTQIVENKVDEKQAEKRHDFVYVNITDTYERIAAKGYKSVELFKKLGDTYFLKGDHKKSTKWYGELFKMDPNQEAEFFYRYATALRSIGQIEQANNLLGLMDEKAGEVVSSEYIKNKIYKMFKINAKH